MEKNVSSNKDSRLVYHQHPTKRDLIEYFGDKIKIRRFTERECFRLMGLNDCEIDNIDNCQLSISNNKRKSNKITKYAKLRMAGNSIVVACLYHIFKKLFISSY